MDSAMPLARAVGEFGAASGLAGHGSLARRRQFYSGPSRLGQSDGDGLLRGAGTVLAFANMVNLFPDKFSGLSAGRLSFRGIFAGTFNCFSFRHIELLSSAVSRFFPLNSTLRRTACGAMLHTWVVSLPALAGDPGYVSAE
jgi:hypothetical protein